MIKYTWKPLDHEGLRLYEVHMRFHAHPEWNKVFVVAAKSPSHAQRLIEAAYKDSQWVAETPVFTGSALRIYQPVDWGEK